MIRVGWIRAAHTLTERIRGELGAGDAGIGLTIVAMARLLGT